MSYKDIVPYTSVFIDFLKSAYWCIKPPKSYVELVADIEQVFRNNSNSNSVIPCLSVRSGLDLFLSVHSFPTGSEIIMSAVNIPSMVEVIHSHGIKVVTLDVDIKTMKPKVELLEALVTSKTRYLLIANIFGRGYDVKPFCDVAKRHNLLLIQDWAEGFSGLDYFGHPDSDLSLFSFGPIKYYTAYGGAIAKVKDINVYHRMKNLHDSYPVQSHFSYLSKVMKLSVGYMLLNCPQLVKPAIYLMRKCGIDHKEKVISLLRGFPSEMMKKIRQRPSGALLATLNMRLGGFSQQAFNQSNVKAEYALLKLPPAALPIGMDADTRNHWLFPVVVNNPEEIIESLNNMGVDAYCGATQLNVLKSDRPVRNLLTPSTNQDYTKLMQKMTNSQFSYYNCSPNASVSPISLTQKSISVANHDHEITAQSKTPEITSKPSERPSSPAKTEAEYLIDHVIYLPINKTVPFSEIDKICKALAKALDTDRHGNNDQGSKNNSHHVTIKSKL